MALTASNPLIAALPVEHDKMGRVKVDKLFQVAGYADVYAVGDNANVPDETGTAPLGTTAQVAVQAGPALARNRRQHRDAHADRFCKPGYRKVSTPNSSPSRKTVRGRLSARAAGEDNL